jgi:hypothetical protein
MIRSRLVMIRARILERANNRCEQCGAPNRAVIYRDGDSYVLDGQRYDASTSEHQGPAPYWEHDGLRATRIVLTVAHLDHGLDDHSDSNLKALCQRCHLAHYSAEHRTHSAETRRRTREDAGQQRLPMEVQGV